QLLLGTLIAVVLILVDIQFLRLGRFAVEEGAALDGAGPLGGQRFLGAAALLGAAGRVHLGPRGRRSRLRWFLHGLVAAAAGRKEDEGRDGQCGRDQLKTLHRCTSLV